MTDKDKESIESTYKGFTDEKKAYMLSLFSHKEILAELDARMTVQENALLKIHETISAT